MPISHNLPASLRYLKARLWILKRPMVWGSATVLVLAAFFIYEFWNHPEWLLVDDALRSSTPSRENLAVSETDQNDPATSSDDAIAIDIDSLPVILSEINESDLEAAEASANQTQTDDSAADSRLGRSPLSALSRADISSAPNASGSSYPFNPSDSSSLDGGLLGFNLNPSNSPAASSAPNQSGLLSPFTPRSSRGIANIYNTPSSSGYAPPSALQTALEQSERSAVERQSQSSSAPAAQPSAQGQNPQDLSTFNQPGGLVMPGGQPMQPTLPSQSMQMSPPAGTTGYTTPPSLYVMPYNSYTNLVGPQNMRALPNSPQVAPQFQPVQPGGMSQPYPMPNYGQQQFGGGAFYSAPAPQPAISQPAPFSVPGGGRIGGGRIDSFSNPLGGSNP